MKRAREGILFDVDEFKRCHEVDDEYMVLGIDEAGRGPAIGPMVYGGAMVTLGQHDCLIDAGVADSKMLSESSRNICRVALEKVSTLQTFMEVISPTSISECMLGRSGKTLNTISHQCAVTIIQKATEAAKGKLVAVYVDTVGIPETYQRMLSGRFPHLRITVSKKADSKFPIVSAASIFAKTLRDSIISNLHLDCGSGYPSDPLTKKWLTSNVHRYFVFLEKEVRLSWAPVMDIAVKGCELIEFEQDVDNQPKLSFSKQPPKRDAVWTHIVGLRALTGL